MVQRLAVRLQSNTQTLAARLQSSTQTLAVQLQSNTLTVSLHRISHFDMGVYEEELGSRRILSPLPNKNE